MPSDSRCTLSRMSSCWTWACEIDGFEILKVLHTEAPHLRVIAVSGSLQGVLLNSAKPFGAASVLEKPVDPEVLVRTTRGFLGEASSQGAAGI
jgi:CheY-like chemotaxis protein